MPVIPMKRALKYPVIMKILAAAALLQFFLSGCSSPTVKIFKKNNIVAIPVDKARRTREEIDRYATYAVYFKLEKAVDSIRIRISAEYVADIIGTRKTRETYFIVEKIIDARKFKNTDVRYFYSEMGRNFDAEWNAAKGLVLVSEKGSPFKALDGNSIYRIRFTPFSSENFVFAVTIDADCGVTFMDEIK